MKPRDPTPELVRARLHYNAISGHFIWRRNSDMPLKWNTKFAGKQAGCFTWRYPVIALNNRRYYAHRLAWIYEHGAIPEGMQIDHINRDPHDNRIANLRLASPALNSANCVGKSKLGLPKGVALHRKSGRYHATIRHGGKRHSLGYHDTPETAGEMYRRAYVMLHEVAA